MVVSLPVTPGPAVAGPLTGGQIWAQLPLQFDLVAVSGTNEYRVNPLAFVSTVALPIFLVVSAVPDAAGLELDADALDAGAVDGVLAAPLELDDELPQAAAINAMAARPPGASHLCGIGILPSPGTARRQASPAPSAAHPAVEGDLAPSLRGFCARLPPTAA
jgi:hypothetical protein